MVCLQAMQAAAVHCCLAWQTSFTQDCPVGHVQVTWQTSPLPAWQVGNCIGRRQDKHTTRQDKHTTRNGCHGRPCARAAVAASPQRAHTMLHRSQQEPREGSTTNKQHSRGVHQHNGELTRHSPNAQYLEVGQVQLFGQARPSPLRHSGSCSQRAAVEVVGAQYLGSLGQILNEPQ